MKLKKLISLGLLVVMTMSTLAACGKTENSESQSQVSAEVSSTSTESQKTTESQESTAASEEASNAVTFPLKETMTFTGFSQMNKTYKVSESPALQKVLEDANMVFELIEVPNTEVKEKGNLLMASGEYPDMLFKSNLKCDQLGMEEGILIPLEDLIREHAPNLTALLDEKGETAWKALQAADGHIYSMPQISNPAIVDSAILWINKSWLDNLGLQEPHSFEELYNVMKDFKEKDANGNGDPNDEIPLTWYDKGIQCFLYFSEYAKIHNIYMAEMDGQHVFYPATEEYRDQFLAYYAKCYEEGILDPLCFTQTVDQMNATGASGDVYGVILTNRPANVVGQDRWADYVPLELTDCVLPLTSGLTKNGLAITDKCKNPEVLVAWADYFYSEEGAILSTLGLEGVNHIMHEDGTWSFINLDSMPQAAFAIQGSCAAPVLIGDINMREKADPMTSTLYATIEKEELYRAYGEVVPTVIYTEEETKRIKDIQADIKPLMTTYRAEVITGIKSLDDTWDEYCATLEAMGAKEYEKIYQEAFARTYQK